VKHREAARHRHEASVVLMLAGVCVGLCLGVAATMASCGSQAEEAGTSSTAAVEVITTETAAPLVIITSSTTTPSSTTSTTARPDPATLAKRKVVTEFFYWYDPVTANHMDEAGPLSLHPPAGRTPSWRDPAWFKSELTDMVYAGIDIAACSYWPKESWADRGLGNLVTALDELVAEGTTPPGIAQFYETAPLWDLDLTTATGKEEFYAPVRRFYTSVPREHWGLIDGRPAIWLYDTGGGHAPAYDASTFEYLYETFTADFGVRPYLVADKSWVVDHDIVVDNTYTWGVAFLGFQPRDSVAGAGPGYDDHLVPGRVPPIVVPRADGAWYERNLYYALASGAQLLWLETWNEHHEATNINETAEYGREYIEITREYVEMFKKGDVPAKPLWGPRFESDTVQLDAAGTGPSAQGLTLLALGSDGGDGGWELVEAAGSPGWATTGDGPGRYLYFALDDGFAYFDTPTDVAITVEYLDMEDASVGPAELCVEYDSYEPGRPAILADRYRPEIMNPMLGTGKWLSATVWLTGVRFANGQNGGADFRLWAGEGQNLTVRRVIVTKTGA